VLKRATYLVGKFSAREVSGDSPLMKEFVDRKFTDKFYELADS